MEYYSVMKKNEFCQLQQHVKDLEGIMLNEISQTEKAKYIMLSLIWGIKKKKKKQPKKPNS